MTDREKKYLIKINYGFGDEFEWIEANSQEEAEKDAYETWLERAESNAHYEAREWTEQLEEEGCY